jgi:hypothetical protein
LLLLLSLRVIRNETEGCPSRRTMAVMGTLGSKAGGGITLRVPRDLRAPFLKESLAQ